MSTKCVAWNVARLLLPAVMFGAVDDVTTMAEDYNKLSTSFELKRSTIILTALREANVCEKRRHVCGGSSCRG
jgi:hypothetical protein